MNAYAIVPVKAFAGSKKRLARILTVDQRIKLSEAMLYDVLQCLCNSSVSKIIVVTGDERVTQISKEFGASIVREEKELGVNKAIALADGVCRQADASMVIPQDLPLIQPEDIEMLRLSARESRCVVITPSHRYDGTNALLRRPPGVMETHYDEDSYGIHVHKASEKGISVKIAMSRRLMLDLDEPGDISHILAANHDCRTTEYLCRIMKNT